jgi:hypothetical protein
MPCRIIAHRRAAGGKSQGLPSLPPRVDKARLRCPVKPIRMSLKSPGGRVQFVVRSLSDQAETRTDRCGVPADRSGHGSIWNSADPFRRTERRAVHRLGDDVAIFGNEPNERP